MVITKVHDLRFFWLEIYLVVAVVDKTIDIFIFWSGFYSWTLFSCVQFSFETMVGHISLLRKITEEIYIIVWSKCGNSLFVVFCTIIQLWNFS